MLDKILERVQKLQAIYTFAHVRFTLYDDCSGSFGYLGQDGLEEIETFDSMLELERLINQD